MGRCKAQRDEPTEGHAADDRPLHACLVHRRFDVRDVRVETDPAIERTLRRWLIAERKRHHAKP